MRSSRCRLAPLLAALALGPSPARADAGAGAPEARFWPSAVCAPCHPTQVEQHLQSRHEKSFTSPLFQAQYFEAVLPRAARDPSIAADARRCTACHAPVSYANTRSLVRTAGVTDPSLSGVTCDLCHTIAGFEGDAPQNGSFVVQPGSRKLGPFKREGSHHATYSELQTRSELCAICHEAVNSHGVRIKATYSEWKGSLFARRGVQCQDCHMSIDGVLVGSGRYESGLASVDSLATAVVRERIYTHRFPGIRSGVPLEGALALHISELPARVAAGRPFTVSLTVDNSRTGHALPTGSADLRLLWLEVEAEVGGRTLALTPENLALGTWAAAGQNSEDALVIGADLPPGARLFRAVYFDRRRRQTLASFDATAIAFDNRLQAGERRRESYVVTAPRDATGLVRLKARLRYRAFPTSLARELDVTPPPIVEVAQVTGEVALDPPLPEDPAAQQRQRLTPMERLRQKTRKP